MRIKTPIKTLAKKPKTKIRLNLTKINQGAGIPAPLLYAINPCTLRLTPPKRTKKSKKPKKILHIKSNPCYTIPNMTNYAFALGGQTDDTIRAYK